MKKENSQQNLAVFTVATYSKHKNIQILHRKKDKNKIWTDLSSLGQEPTFNLLGCATLFFAGTSASLL